MGSTISLDLNSLCDPRFLQLQQVVNAISNRLLPGPRSQVENKCGFGVIQSGVLLGARGSSSQPILQFRVNARDICDGFFESKPFAAEKNTVLPWGLLTLDKAYRDISDIDEAYARGVNLVLGEQQVVDRLVGTQSFRVPGWDTEARSKRANKEWRVHYDLS